MDVRLISSLDWPEFKRWVPTIGDGLSLYPINSSFVVYDSSRLYCAGALYLPYNSLVGFVEGLISNPDVDARSKLLSCQLISDYATAFARDRGIACLISYSTSEAHTRFYRSLGFNPTVSNLTQIVRYI